MATQVYYLGPPYTFGEQAALTYIRQTGKDLPSTPLSSHDRVIEATEAEPDAIGVVAIENSLGGGVNDVVDAILRARGLFVCGEIVVPIVHNLIAPRGTRIETISVVMSHPQALAQCHDFLQSHLPDARLDASLSTAGAVEEALKTPGAAASLNARCLSAANAAADSASPRSSR